MAVGLFFSFGYHLQRYNFLLKKFVDSRAGAMRTGHLDWANP